MKKQLKNNISKNKKKVLSEITWGNGLSLVEEKKDKCLIVFPMCPYGTWDEDLGLIAILLKYGIYGSYVKPSDSNKYPEEIVFEYAKKHSKKIKSIEKAYFKHKISIDAKDMSMLLMLIINLDLRDL
jgi:hypothetical protein